MRLYFALHLSQPAVFTVLFTVSAVFAGCAAAPAQSQPVTATVSTTDSHIHYFGAAILHDWRGTSQNVEGRLFVDPSAPSRSVVELSAPVASFDSGNQRRDRKMREATAASTFGLVRFRTSTVEPVSWEWDLMPDGYAGTWSVSGALSFHGHTHPIRTDVDVRVERDTVFAQTTFSISLKRFGVARPELLWIAPISDEIRIEAQIAAPVSDSRTPDYEVVETALPGGRRALKSSTPRPVFAIGYAGRDAGITTAYRDVASGPDFWSLSLQGVPQAGKLPEYALDANKIAEEHPMHLKVDGMFVRPLQVTSETRQLENGEFAEVKTGHFTRGFFKRIAQARTVVVTVGAATFVLPYSVRRDLRLILDETAEPQSDAVSRR